MKPQVLPETFLRCLPKEARKPLGKAAVTTAEAIAAADVKAERELHHEITNFLRLRGIVAGHNRMDRKSTTLVGWPDFVFVVRGPGTPGGNWHAIPVAVEVKVGRNGLSDEQAQVMAQMTLNGWVYNTIRSLAELKTFLDALQGEKS